LSLAADLLQVSNTIIQRGVAGEQGH